MENAIVYYNDGQTLVAMPTYPDEINGSYYIRFTTTHFSEYILFDRIFEARLITNEKEIIYFSLAEAFQAAFELGGTVVLESDVDLDETLSN